MDQLATGTKTALRATLGELRDVFIDPWAELSWGGVLRFLVYGLIVLGLKLGHDYAGAGPLRLFPKQVFLSRSLRQDVGLIFVNSALAGLLAGAVMSIDDGSARVMAGARVLVTRVGASMLGPAAAARVSTHETLARAVYAVTILVVMDGAGFIHHVLSHRVRLLWEFHKVHHSAQVLSPTTFRRFHILEGLLRALFLAVFLGLSVGALRLVFGPSEQAPAYVAGGLVLYHVVAALTQVLNHSHIWWSWGKLEVVLNSPAMHAIHHSREPRHHDRNFGAIFSVFDRLLGTRYRTTRQPERLYLGVDDGFDWAGASQWQLFRQPIRAWLQARRPRPAPSRGSAVG